MHYNIIIKYEPMQARILNRILNTLVFIWIHFVFQVVYKKKKSIYKKFYF